MPTVREGNPGFAPLQIGSIIEESIADPGVGNEIVFTAPSASGSANAELFRILGFKFVFIADANVANREVALILRNVANTLSVGECQPPTGSPQTASVTFTYIWAPNQPFHEVIQNARRFEWMPAWWIIPGQSLRTSTVGIQAGDEFVSIILTLQRWKVA